MPISFQMKPKCLNKMMHGIFLMSLPNKAPRVPKCLSAPLPECPSALRVLSLECVRSGLGIKRSVTLLEMESLIVLKSFLKTF